MALRKKVWKNPKKFSANFREKLQEIPNNVISAEMTALFPQFCIFI